MVQDSPAEAAEGSNGRQEAKQTSGLPAPGEILQLDFRPSHDTATDAPASGARSRVRLLTWNIERGYKLQEVIAELRRCDADIIALQEVDIGCERSACEDTGRRIAEALQMKYLFLCEFEELWSPLRDAASQGGGVHGNAILSRFDISEARVIEHREHPVDWENATLPCVQQEPRRGRRSVLAATVQTPHGPLLAYCLHQEVFCGMLARVAQFSDVLRDSREQLRQGVFHQAILGDLNTMAHGVARLSRTYCTDVMRWRTLGQTEAQWFHANVLSEPDTVFQPESDAQRAAGVPATGANQRLLRLGLREDVCQDVLNPGFADPFDVRLDTTLDNPKYKLFNRSFMTGKLDWLLLRRLSPVATAIGRDYHASDHKWLSADVVIMQPAAAAATLEDQIASGTGQQAAASASDAFDATVASGAAAAAAASSSSDIAAVEDPTASGPGQQAAANAPGAAAAAACNSSGAAAAQDVQGAAS